MAAALGEKLSSLALLAVLALGAGCSGDGSPASGQVDAFKKGVSYTNWTRDGFDSESSDRSLEALRATGTEWIALVVTWYVESVDSPAVYRAENTPSDAGVVRAIRKAHDLGFRVMLKPHVDVANGDPSKPFLSSRSWISFRTGADWDAWFASYGSFVTHYAGMARENGAEMFCTGTELSKTESHEDGWRGIVEEVRAVYPGPVTYAALLEDPVFSALGLEDILDPFFGGKHRWWDALDYGGVDAYYPLALFSNDPPVETLVRNWNDFLGFLRWIDFLEEWQAKIARPVLFTEIGYRSADGNAKNPADWWTDAPVDLAEQADLYTAFFRAFSGRSWLKGAFWWDWGVDPDQGGPEDTGFTVHGKPAEAVLAQGYATDPTTAPASSSRSPSEGGASAEARKLLRYAIVDGRDPAMARLSLVFLGSSGGLVKIDLSPGTRPLVRSAETVGQTEIDGLVALSRERNDLRVFGF